MIQNDCINVTLEFTPHEIHYVLVFLLIQSSISPFPLYIIGLYFKWQILTNHFSIPMSIYPYIYIYHLMFEWECLRFMHVFYHVMYFCMYITAYVPRQAWLNTNIELFKVKYLPISWNQCHGHRCHDATRNQIISSHVIDPIFRVNQGHAQWGPSSYCRSNTCFLWVNIK